MMNILNDEKMKANICQKSDSRTKGISLIYLLFKIFIKITRKINLRMLNFAIYEVDKSFESFCNKKET